MQVLAFKIQLLLWTTSTMPNNVNVIMPPSANPLSYSHPGLNGYQVQNWQIKTFIFLVNFFNIPVFNHYPTNVENRVSS